MKNVNRQLSGRQIIYHLLALLYRGEIASGLNVLQESAFLLQFVGDWTAFAGNIAPLAEEVRLQQDLVSYEAKVKADYLQLFVGPGHVLAPPWASAYLTKEKLLFGEPERIVRQFYRAIGLTVSQSEPADHIAVELAFMARLCAFEQIGNRMAGGARNTRKMFLDTHLLPWVAVWQADVRQQAHTDFWRIVTAAMYRWLLEETDNLACSARQAENCGGDPAVKQDRQSGMSATESQVELKGI